MTQLSVCLTRLTILTLSLLALTACERESYTTWSCNSATEEKVPMILKKALMEFQGMKFDYCGSLGNQSYFDQQCPGMIQESQIIFTPSTGTLLKQSQPYQCIAL